MKLGSINFIQQQKIQMQKVSFRGENWYDPYVDTFESSTSSDDSAKKKKGFFTNPIKAAQEQAKAIIAAAKKEAFDITYEARLKAESEAEQYLSAEKRKARAIVAEDASRYERTLRSEIDSQIEYSRKYYAEERSRLSAENNALQTQVDEKKRLFQALNDGYIKKEIASKKAQIMSRISAYQIDYDYNKPIEEQKERKTPISKKEPTVKFSDYTYIPPEFKPETKLDIPEFVSGQNWIFQVPESSSIKIPEYTPLEFSELHDQETNISMSYADSVKWNSDKISRDILQNFFDGHGQTLDGVKMSFDKQENGKYKVRIEGQAQYSQEKAILLGETTKRNNSKAAGNYGEGLKVVVLKLLKEYGASSVDIGSDNWNVRFNPMKSNICEKDVLSYSLLKQEPVQGNYLEFETDNEELLKSLTSAINNFYHSNNPDFQNPVFENDLFAIKKLGEKDKGSVYIAGQKFEYMNLNTVERGWNVLPGYTLVFKEKPTGKNDFDISRDRMILQEDHIKSLVLSAVASDKTSTEDILKLLTIFKSSWKDDCFSYNSDKMSNVLLESILSAVSRRGIRIEFPSQYLASQKGFNDKGYDYFYKDTHTICKPIFSAIGMKRTLEKAAEDKPQCLIQPSEIQVKKIAVLKETINCLKSSILRAKPEYYSRSLNPNIYIFEKSDVFAGEHRQDGFWISDTEMSESFDRVLSTVLHEIGHEFGGDGTEEFTYTLTAMLQAVINATLKDQETLITLRALKACWDDLNQQELGESLVKAC